MANQNLLIIVNKLLDKNTNDHITPNKSGNAIFGFFLKKLYREILRSICFFSSKNQDRGIKRVHPPTQIQRPVVRKKPVLEDSDSDEENISDESLDSD